MNITHCSTEGVKRVRVLSQKAVSGMLNEAEPNQKKGGFAFITFNLNDEDVCSLRAAKVQTSSYTQRNNRISDVTSVRLLVYFFSFESNEHLRCQTKPKRHYNNLPCH